MAAALLAASLVTAIPAQANSPSDSFYRMFPNLPGFSTPTQQQIADLAQSQLDPNLPERDNLGLTSGFTYFGQFLDHDLTLDTSPPPTSPVDPTTLTNSRTFALDLDSMYGGGLTGSPQFFDTAGHFLLQEPNANGVRDYVRNPDGSAVINEARNDENEVISQIQITMMKAHNRLIDEGLTFDDARATLVAAYQRAVFDDYLPHILSPSVDPKIVKKLNPKNDGTPIEFSVAAFRFGHSQVRKAYILNETTGKVQVFSPTAPDLRGGRDIPAGRQIHWGEFFSDIPLIDTDGNPINFGRMIDPLLSSGLFALPIPGAEATGSNVLAFRNMSRAGFYALPDGQDVARAVDMPVISPQTINAGPGFENGTPLWYYILAESDRIEGGTHLGPTGSTIVAASFNAALKNAKVRGHVRDAQEAEIVGADNAMTLSDLFVFAGTSQGQ